MISLHPAAFLLLGGLLLPLLPLAARRVALLLCRWPDFTISSAIRLVTVTSAP